ncbi:MAG: hypothetical protein U0228_27815 [Myxococcaceae bacterium]
MNHLRLALGVSVVFSFAIFVSCGAENQVAPPAEENPDIRHCRGFDQLMPNFLKAISEGKTENLKRLVENQLLVSDRADTPPPINEVLRVIFRTLERFALKPREANAPAGEFCAPTASPPPLNQANELCEMRRALDVLVHQGKGIDAINQIEPQLVVTLNYLTGSGLDCKGRPRVPHYEVAGVISSFCTQNANCQLSDGLDLAVGFTDYVNTPEGLQLINDLYALAEKPSITGLLNPSSLTENDMVAIVRALIPAIENANPTDLRNAFSSLPLPQQVKDDLQPVVSDLEKLLAHQEIVTPMKRSLNCFTNQDRNFDTIRMTYRLAIDEACPEFGLSRLLGAIKGLQDVDKRGSIIYIINVLAKAVRTDELAIDSAANVCRTILSTSKAPGEVKSNAELALPAAADLVKAGVVNEGICAADTLIFGCAGGNQPACR